MSATALSGTLAPLAVGTGRFSSVARSLRLLSRRLTRIGTWRSDSENLALYWSRSPRVAMRIVSLMLSTVTPSWDARSRCGRTRISGLGRSLSMRELRSTDMPPISSTTLWAVV